jgi:hypothetical protein
VKIKLDTDSVIYQALRRFEERRPRGRESYPVKGRIFGITLGLRWRAICEKFLTK